jgi:hypothetical protein
LSPRVLSPPAAVVGQCRHFSISPEGKAERGEKESSELTPKERKKRRRKVFRVPLRLSGREEKLAALLVVHVYIEKKNRER